MNNNKVQLLWETAVRLTAVSSSFLLLSFPCLYVHIHNHTIFSLFITQRRKQCSFCVLLQYTVCGKHLTLSLSTSTALSHSLSLPLLHLCLCLCLTVHAKRLLQCCYPSLSLYKHIFLHSLPQRYHDSATRRERGYDATD